MRSNLRRIFVVAILAVLAISLGGYAVVSFRRGWHRKQLLPYEIGPIADVYWEIGGKPLVISCAVVDANDKPHPGVHLDFRNNSGGNPAVTDDDGLAKVSVGEPDLEQILVNGVVVMNRPEAYRHNDPSVLKGLIVKIVIKDPGAVGILENDEK